MHPSEDIKGSKSRVLADKKIILAITGSIAAVETVKLARELIRHGADVVPVMSPEAARIIHPNSVEFATGKKPITELSGAVEHVEHCGDREGKADLLLIAPATANTISKIACGIDDTPVTTFATTAIGTGIKVMIAPAMHSSMYAHSIVRENIAKLESIGVRFCWPDMDENKAKLASFEEIAARACNCVNENGKKALIIAGPTSEPLDDMRTITNLSSGKTGLALASAAYLLGYDTQLWLGRGVQAPGFLHTEEFTTTESIFELVSSGEGSLFDIIINLAAISDYTPIKRDGKIRSEQEGLVIELEANQKVMPELKKLLSPEGKLIGFKAESGTDEDELVARGRGVLDRYGLDLVAANCLDVAGGDSTKVYLIGGNGVEEFTGKKREFAYWLLERINNGTE